MRASELRYMLCRGVQVMSNCEWSRWIDPDSLNGSVAEARLRESLVPVWALVGHARGLNGDAERVAADYGVPVEAVQAALAYYKSYRAELDDRIRANAA